MRYVLGQSYQGWLSDQMQDAALDLRENRGVDGWWRFRRNKFGGHLERGPFCLYSVWEIH